MKEANTVDRYEAFFSEVEQRYDSSFSWAEMEKRALSVREAPGDSLAAGVDHLGALGDNHRHLDVMEYRVSQAGQKERRDEKQRAQEGEDPSWHFPRINGTRGEPEP